MTIDARPSDLEAFRPETDGPWDPRQAAHLCRRAAFGSPPELVDRLVREGHPVAAMSTLFDSTEDDDALDLLGDVTARGRNFESVQGWWVYRMLFSRAPAREKLSLFWHDHFATSQRKVRNPRLMMGQVELFLRLGAGVFDDLLLAVARDPAMVLWLDGNTNRRGKPNENFARELMELFSLGIGHYTEQDIQEAARAFTGWHEREEEFWFHRRSHDSGPKTVFGETIESGEDVVKLCASRPAGARFIASKLFRAYVHPEPSSGLEALLGETFERDGRRVDTFLRRLLASRLFYRDDVRRSIVASPAEFAIGALATLGARANTTEVAESMAGMGQDLLRPPSVKGWDGGLAWINSTTLLARYRYAMEIAAGYGSLDAVVPWEEIESGGTEGVIARFFPESLPPTVTRPLFEAADGDVRAFVGGCLQLPESQYV